MANRSKISRIYFPRKKIEQRVGQIDKREREPRSDGTVETYKY